MIVLTPFRGFLAPAGGSFDPLSLSPTLWLDSSDQTRVFDATTGGSLPADGGAIARIVSKEGSSIAFTQATLANRPIRRAASVNGLDTAEYSGSATNLSLANSTLFSSADEFTLFFVARNNFTGVNRNVFGISSQTTVSSARFVIGYSTANRMVITSRRDDADTAVTFSPANTFPSGYFLARVALNYQTQTVSAAVNGISWGSQSSFGTAGATDPDLALSIRVGAFSSGVTPAMDFGTLFAFRRILTAGEISSLESWLLTRYGII